MTSSYPRVARLRDAETFRQHIQDLGIELPFDEDLISGEGNPLAQPYVLPDGSVIGNRFCTLPMEGWDGTLDGKPTEQTIRRWKHFGRSGAKLIWGGEAVAVRHDGRANPNQLLIDSQTLKELESLRLSLVEEHIAKYGSADDLYVGLQLTHSGRFSRPNEKSRLEPKIVYHHPVVDGLFNLPEDYPLMTDGEIEDLIADYVRAAEQAQRIGFDFVDIKHCHGYLGHEFLSARWRPGPYGGSFENRTRFLREVVSGIREQAPGLGIGVRLSAFDWGPFRAGGDGVGEPGTAGSSYPYAFGGDGTGTGIDLAEPIAFLHLLRDLDIRLVNLSATLNEPRPCDPWPRGVVD